MQDTQTSKANITRASLIYPGMQKAKVQSRDCRTHFHTVSNDTIIM